ncbi:hypothetical protein ADK90_11470, partial [Streptomyces sp. XY413]
DRLRAQGLDPLEGRPPAHGAPQAWAERRSGPGRVPATAGGPRWVPGRQWPYEYQKRFSTLRPCARGAGGGAAGVPPPGAGGGGGAVPTARAGTRTGLRGVG